MENLKDDIKALIEDYFSSKTRRFDFRGDSQMKDYIGGMVSDLCESICDRLEDKEKEIDDELEWWESEHGPEYYHHKRNQEEWLATRML